MLERNVLRKLDASLFRGLPHRLKIHPLWFCDF